MKGIKAAGAPIVVACAMAFLGSWPAAANTFPYRVLRRVTLPGAAGVRALASDSSGRFVYAGQGDLLSAYAAASAIRIDTRLLEGSVSALAVGANGEVVAATRQPAGLEFLTPKSLRVVRERALHWQAPSALLYDRREHMLFLESRPRRTIARLDPSSGEVLGSVRLTGRLGEMASNGRGTLYVANVTHDSLDVIDVRRMKYEGAIPLRGCRAPTGLAMDTVGRRLFVGCRNGQALIVDADLGFVFVRMPIQVAARVRNEFAFHPLGRRGWKGGAFIAGGDALDAIQMQTFVRYRAAGRLSLADPCTAMTLVPRAGRLWLALAPEDGKPARLWILGARNGQSP